MSSKSYSDMLPFKSWDVLFVTKAHRSCDRLICMIRTGMHDDVIFYCGEEEECNFCSCCGESRIVYIHVLKILKYPYLRTSAHHHSCVQLILWREKDSFLFLLY